MGNGNSKVGNEREEDICGEYRLVDRNERTRLIEFCEEYKLVIV